MKLRYEIVIDADRHTVWEAFDNTSNLRRWQPNLISCTAKSGEPREAGAVSELVYDESGRRVELTETITERRPPDFMAGMYESSHGTMLTVHTFEDAGTDRTRWTAWSNATFTGLTKYLAIFMVRSIRRRMEDDMQRFKLLVETLEASAKS